MIEGAGGADVPQALFYDKTEVWIDSEKLYEVLYSFELED